ncbi:tyrosine-type recombinase/integrase [Microbacterium sp.]|uniref:tyrosine-type recombinase/integrase n=1 Tax=Microbacterium sp. TaxID=51671 RepID=UPI002736AF51|nr:tyrosine-type recombinase/integrase [Microbacterium sp.]MDP3951557.1 tyrosine-type recombinase/integrase [Microbacterium sp.]
MKDLPSFESVLAPVIASHLSLRRALGRQDHAECRVLARLDHLLAAGAADLTAESFAHWCLTLEHLASGTRREHLRIVRSLCLYRRRGEPACFVPDAQLFPPVHQRLRPHLFTDDEVVRVLAQADALRPTYRSPLRSQTFHLAIVLLFTTGLRRREIVRLTVRDYDPRERTLWIRDSKFHKSRVVPLSGDGAREIDSYLGIRRTRRLPVSPDSALLWHRQRAGLTWSGDAFGHAMHALIRRAGIRTVAGRTPRVHDFRHGFAVRALLRWYRAGANVQAKLPVLARYMGHVSIASTDYYLGFLESVAASASARFAQHCGALITASNRVGGGQ